MERVTAGASSLAFPGICIAIARAALCIADAWTHFRQTRGRAGRSWRDQGSNQRQSDRSRDAERADGLATRSAANRRFRFDKQASFRQLLKGHLHHGFVDGSGELLRKNVREFQSAPFAIAQLPCGRGC
jgi:hypothetical protein